MNLKATRFQFPGLYLPEAKKLIALLLRIQKPAPLIALTASRAINADDFGGKLVNSTATNIALTVPNNDDVAFPIGATIPLHRAGSGTLTVVGDDGVTVSVATGKAAGLLAQHTKAELLKTGENAWVLTGDLAAA